MPLWVGLSRSRGTGFRLDRRFGAAGIVSGLPIGFSAPRRGGASLPRLGFGRSVLGFKGSAGLGATVTDTGGAVDPREGSQCGSGCAYGGAVTLVLGVCSEGGAISMGPS